MAKMREAEAWRMVAEALEPGNGICWTLVHHTPRIPDMLKFDMRHRRLWEHRIAHHGSENDAAGEYVYEDFGAAGTEARILACLWMALEAEDEV